MADITYKDWRGTEIKVGSKVVYPTRRGSSLDVEEATVTEIIPQDKTKYPWKEYTLKVERPSTKWVSKGSYEDDNYSYDQVDYIAKITLTEIGRVTVVN